MPGTRPARLLHTSDCHLDKFDGGREQVAFAAAIDLAIEADVDAVLVTGDLFDHRAVADDLLEWTAAELDRAGRPVVLLVGNHDALHDESVHHRFTAPARCREVLLLDDPEGSLVEVPGTDIVVWGRGMVEHEPSFRPLVGVPPRRDGAWCVVAGHGLTVTSDADKHRSSPILPSDLDAIDWDYIALGHNHRHNVVRTEPVLACYAGATAERNGVGPGAVVVDFEPGVGPQLRWAPLAVP